MKIAHYINNLGSGGAEKQLVDYLPLLAAKGINVKLIVCNNKVSIPSYLEELSQNGVEVIDLKSSFYSPLQLIKLIKVVKREKFDIIHGHLFPSQYWLAIASIFFSKKIKLIKTEHSSSNNRRKYRFFQIIEKFIYSRFIKVIGITEDVSLNLQKWIGSGSEKIVFIPNGVILKNNDSSLFSKVDFLKKENFNILMVARLSQDSKNHKDLILSLKYLPVNVHLYFAGEGPDENALKKIVSENAFDDRVHFLGMRTDARSLMDNVNLNVLISHGEGLSGVALESMASKRPFIGSNVSGINNIVPNEDFLCQNGNPEKLASKILNIKQSSQEEINRLVSLGNNRAANFDLNKIVEQYYLLYQNV